MHYGHGVFEHTPSTVLFEDHIECSFDLELCFIQINLKPFNVLKNVLKLSISKWLGKTYSGGWEVQIQNAHAIEFVVAVLGAPFLVT